MSKFVSLLLCVLMLSGIFATTASAASGSSNVTVSYSTSRFSDVGLGQWYAAAVERAADNGIVRGMGEGEFNPNTEITREQMAVMLYNYMKYKGYPAPLLPL